VIDGASAARGKCINKQRIEAVRAIQDLPVDRLRFGGRGAGKHTLNTSGKLLLYLELWVRIGFAKSAALAMYLSILGSFFGMQTSCDSERPKVKL